MSIRRRRGRCRGRECERCGRGFGRVGFAQEEHRAEDGARDEDDGSGDQQGEEAGGHAGARDGGSGAGEGGLDDHACAGLLLGVLLALRFFQGFVEKAHGG